ncbi:MAG: 50S ribosomal protein L11 methyltransferase [Tissierellia bacterium]|nr:50S ribosomal protein L11 methyltransferase [Tissierellia bacterium]
MTKEVIITIKKEDEEKALYHILDLNVSAMEVRDADLASSFTEDEKKWDYIDLPKNSSDTIEILFYVEEDEVESIRDHLKNVFHGDISIQSGDVNKEDYENNWKEHFKPISISSTRRVLPPWEKANDGDIIIDPGLAFGTGNHETTLLCLRAIDQHVGPGNLLDVGTGSGILSIAAAKMHGCQCDAYDLDPAAIASAKSNVDRNHVSDKVNLYLGDFTKEDIKTYDYIVANIYAEVLMDMMEHFAERMDMGGTIILSGIVRGKEEKVIHCMAKNGFMVYKVDRENQWVCIRGMLHG